MKFFHIDKRTPLIFTIALCVFFFITTFVPRPANAHRLSEMIAIIKQQLSLDSRINSSTIKVAEKNGVIEVIGEVGSLAERDFVEETVQRFSGSSYSMQGLWVNPPVIPDETIRQSILVAVPAHAQVHIQNFKVRVLKGSVTLDGTVEALNDRSIAEYVVKNIRGVRSLVNNILVAGTRSSDDLIYRNIRAVLTPYLKDNSLPVISVLASVKDGRVELEGRVANLEQKRKVEELVRNVPGVISISNKILLRIRTRYNPLT